MAAATAVREGGRKGAWLRYALAFSISLHIGVVVWMYHAKAPAPVMRQIERIFPVFIVPPRPAPRPPPPPPPQEPLPRKKDAGGQAGQGRQEPAVPIRTPERVFEPERTINVPPVRNPDPEATSLVSSAGKGEAPGDGRGAAPGPGSGVGKGTGDGPGSGPRAAPGWRPQWRRLPTPQESGRHYPQAARVAGLEGRVIMKCTVGVTGRVFNCVPLRESPAGQGFGAAAVAMSRYLRISPKRVNGKAVEADLLVPLNLGLEGTSVVPLKPSE